MKTLLTTPKEDGFRMPGEFELNDACWLLWPERTDIWPNGGKPAQNAFVRIASAISQFQHVTIGVSSRQYDNARQRLPSQVRVIEISYNGCWIRDTGPTFLINDSREIRGVDWKFNAWGGLQDGLYFPWDLDDKISSKILDIENIDRYPAPLTIEGGAIASDGQGTLMTTEACVLNQNRNPHLSKAEVELLLCSFTGADSIIWLPRGLMLDETGGHIDNICAFIRPAEVALAWTDNKNDPQYQISLEAYKSLSSARDCRGRKIKIHKVPLPPSILISKGESDSIDQVEGTVSRPTGAVLPASYINFYIANEAVFIPQFNAPTDKLAIEVFTRIFHDKIVIPLDTSELLIGGGNIHCNTQQQPIRKL